MCIRDRVCAGDFVRAGGAINLNERGRRAFIAGFERRMAQEITHPIFCLLYTSDAADERSSVDLGGRRIIKKKKTNV